MNEIYIEIDKQTSASSTVRPSASQQKDAQWVALVQNI